MSIERLYTILAESTIQLRKGEELEGTPELVKAVKNLQPEDSIDNLPGGVLEVYAMPHESEAPSDIVKVDVEFIVVGVNRAKAEEYRAELAKLIPEIINPELLASGPSYIAVGGEIGDQGAAFQLFAVGQVLGFWTIITPKRLGIVGPMAREMAGSGFIMIDGFRPDGLKSRAA